jgi:hypothetical protein
MATSTALKQPVRHRIVIPQQWTRWPVAEKEALWRQISSALRQPGGPELVKERLRGLGLTDSLASDLVVALEFGLPSSRKAMSQRLSSISPNWETIQSALRTIAEEAPKSPAVPMPRKPPVVVLASKGELVMALTHLSGFLAGTDGSLHLGKKFEKAFKKGELLSPALRAAANYPDPLTTAQRAGELLHALFNRKESQILPQAVAVLSRLCAELEQGESTPVEPEWMSWNELSLPTHLTNEEQATKVREHCAVRLHNTVERYVEALGTDFQDSLRRELLMTIATTRRVLIGLGEQ